MGFLWPQCLLLAFLIPVVLRLTGSRPSSTTGMIRAALLALAVLLLARPTWDDTEDGMDVWVLLDRSASIGAEGYARQQEMLQLINKAKTRGVHDRIGLISYGEEARLAAMQRGETVAIPEDLTVNANASDLTQALRLAERARTRTRKTRLLVLSDGLSTGEDPVSPDLLSQLDGLPVWTRALQDNAPADAAVLGVQLPDHVSQNTAFVIRYDLYCPQETRATVRLRRNGKILQERREVLPAGISHFFGRDVADQCGVLNYEVEVAAENDRRVENNTASALTRVTGAPRVLIVSSRMTPGAWDTVLERGAVPFDRITPADSDWSAARLAPYRVIILENLPLGAIGHEGVASLAMVVSRGLAGLIVTGGANAFGQGGYHKSDLDPLLPVSMELREEQRRGLLALVAVLDRSGSMTAPVSGGRTKMDLANAGTAEAVRMLSPMDQVGVIAVDSSEHIIVPLSQADDTGKLVDVIRRIESMGGGIFVRTGLLAAEREIAKSTLPTRHVLLFADASDSEEQEDCLDIAARLRKEQISISVIALGKENDSDAEFLKQLAAAGAGEIYFTTSAEELPRLFTQDVIRISRRGLMTDPVNTLGLADLIRLKLPGLATGPQLGGYCLSSLRPGASCALATADDFKAPVVAFWQKGKASVAAVTAEVDGKYTGSFLNWRYTPDMLINLVRLVASGIHVADGKGYSQAERGYATVRFEFTPEQARKLQEKELSMDILPPQGMKAGSSALAETPTTPNHAATKDGANVGTSPDMAAAPTDAAFSVPLKWVSPTIAEGGFPLRHPGHYQPVIADGQDQDTPEILRAPPITLSYSPEFQPSAHGSGTERLHALARATGGKHLDHADEMFDPQGLHAATRPRPLDMWILVGILLLLLAEIAQRRIGLFPESVRWLKEMAEKLRLNRG